MAKEQDGEQQDLDDSSSVKKSRFPIKIILMIFLNFMGLAGGFFLVHESFNPEDIDQVKESALLKEWEEANVGLDDDFYIYSLNSISARLSDSPRRYVQIKLDLEMLDQVSYEEISDLGAEARDKIFKLLGGKGARDILTIQGKLQLKQEIIAGINSFLQKGIVKNIYFKRFAIE